MIELRWKSVKTAGVIPTNIVMLTDGTRVDGPFVLQYRESDYPISALGRMIGDEPEWGDWADVEITDES